MKMLQPKFTDGEWMLVKDMSKDCFLIETNDFSNIAEIHMPVPYDDKDDGDHTREWVANARLIHHAPQMYKLLRQVQQLIVAEHLMNKYVVGEESPITSELTKNISVLLRQIDEGGSSRPKSHGVY